jgi:hypothetical protein
MTSVLHFLQSTRLMIPDAMLLFGLLAGELSIPRARMNDDERGSSPFGREKTDHPDVYPSL